MRSLPSARQVQGGGNAAPDAGCQSLRHSPGEDTPLAGRCRPGSGGVTAPARPAARPASAALPSSQLALPRVPTGCSARRRRGCLSQDTRLHPEARPLCKAPGPVGPRDPGARGPQARQRAALTGSRPRETVSSLSLRHLGRTSPRRSASPFLLRCSVTSGCVGQWGHGPWDCRGPPGRASWLPEAYPGRRNTPQCSLTPYARRSPCQPAAVGPDSGLRPRSSARPASPGAALRTACWEL